jgi:hypothetical protein
MNEETTVTRKTDHSTLFSISIRAWLTLIVVFTVCYMSIFGIKIEEPLYTLVGMVIGYYFGQSPKQKTP